MSFVSLFYVLVYVMSLRFLMSDTTSNPNVAGKPFFIGEVYNYMLNQKCRLLEAPFTCNY